MQVQQEEENWWIDQTTHLTLFLKKAMKQGSKDHNVAQLHHCPVYTKILITNAGFLIDSGRKLYGGEYCHPLFVRTRKRQAKIYIHILN